MNNQRRRMYDDPRVNAAVEELSAYRKLQRDINYMRAKLEEYRDSYTGIHIQDFGEIKVDCSANVDFLVETAVKWADLDFAIRKRCFEKEKLYWQLQIRIDRLSSTQARIVSLYYLQGMNIDQIGKSLGYSNRQVLRIKREAIEKFAYL